MGKSLRAALFSCVLLMCLSVPSLAQTCSSYAFTSNQQFTSCSDLSQLNSYIYWNYHAANTTADIAFRRSGTTTTEWVVWALNPSGQRMVGSQAIVGFHNSSGLPTAHTTSIDSTGPTMQAGSLSFVVTNVRAEYINSEMIIYATLHLTSSLVSTNQVWQYGPMSGTAFGQHSMSSANQASVGTIDFTTGTTAAGSAPSNRKKNVHGLLNAVSWGIMLPTGMMIARYLKVFKVANPAWFYLHVGCQSIGYGIGVAGWATGLKLGSDSPGIKHNKHRNLGIILFCLATIQVFALFLRPKPDHKYRFHWNIYHWTVGYAILILGTVNIYEGLDILDPEKKWKNAFNAIMGVLGVVAVVLEVYTWMFVIRRKKRDAAKHTNGVTTNGYSA